MPEPGSLRLVLVALGLILVARGGSRYLREECLPSKRSSIAMGRWSGTCAGALLRDHHDAEFKVIAAALLTSVVAAIGLAFLHRATADGLRPVAKSEATPRGREVPIVRKLEHGEQVLSVAFSPDGQHLATGGCDKTARVHDPGTKTGALTWLCLQLSGVSPAFAGASGLGEQLSPSQA